jgi:hypothetical protein
MSASDSFKITLGRVNVQKYERIGFAMLDLRVLMSVAMKSSTFWDITRYSWVKDSLDFRGTYCLHLQGQRVCQTRNQHEAGLLLADFLLGLLFHPEDGGNVISQNTELISIL